MVKIPRQYEFKKLLRKTGQKATPSRLAVLEILEKNQKPLSAHDIIELARQKMDQATVYRIIKALKTKGLIRQIDFRHNHAHYEIVSEKEHHHLICTSCGKVEDVHYCEVEEAHSAILKKSKYFTEIKQHSLEFYGRCKACSKKLGQSS